MPETDLVKLEILSEFLPRVVDEAFSKLPTELLNAPEDELYPNPNLRHIGIRRNLWRGIKKAQETPGFQLTTKDIVGSYMLPGTFTDKIKIDEVFTAWLAHPPLEEMEFLDAALEIGQKKLIDILKMDINKIQRDKSGQPMYDTDGKLIRATDFKAAKLIVDVFTLLDKRKHGEYTQKILQKGQVEHTHEKKDAKEIINVPSLEEIDAKIALLEGNERKTGTDSG